MKTILPYILAVFLLVSAGAHAINPEFYELMIPDFISKTLANGLAVVVEAGIGILLLLPQYRKYGGLGFLLLMIAFLPIHVWDLFRETPAIGPSPAPIIRLVLQFVLIYAGWYVFKTSARRRK